MTMHLSTSAGDVLKETLDIDFHFHIAIVHF